MVVTTLDAEAVEDRGHRLGDLVRVLAGCDAAAAELAVAGVLDRPPPDRAAAVAGPDQRPLAPERALDTVAAALVRLRHAPVDPGAAPPPA